MSVFIYCTALYGIIFIRLAVFYLLGNLFVILNNKVSNLISVCVFHALVFMVEKFSRLEAIKLTFDTLIPGNSKQITNLLKVKFFLQTFFQSMQVCNLTLLNSYHSIEWFLDTQASCSELHPSFT